MQREQIFIAAEKLTGHEYCLAFDEMKGRGTDTDEYRRVAQYGSSGFRVAGLKTLFTNEKNAASFLQPFKSYPNYSNMISSVVYRSLDLYKFEPNKNLS